MSLRLLLDENISDVVAQQVRLHRGGIHIESVHTWRAGAFRGRRDPDLLRAAREEGWTLVTYDQNTIPPLFFEFIQAGEEHAGVIFIDDRTIRPEEFGLLVRSLIAFWEVRGNRDWTNQVMYLNRAV
jgi:predicted nuclease of predicted toxin-antitoxin system